MNELFTTNIGSHMWKMNHENSDIDLATVYIMDSRDFLLGKQAKGRQKINKEGNIDTTYYEIGHVINHLMKGNVNYIWAVMSPIIINDYHSFLKELRGLVAGNMSKNCFNSINGLAKHNIYHFIENSDEVDRRTYNKKLNIIGRTIQFGINALLFGKYMFQKVDIESKEELYRLKGMLNEAYKNSMLPERPDPEPYKNFLIKLRIHQLRKDKII